MDDSNATIYFNDFDECAREIIRRDLKECLVSARPGTGKTTRLPVKLAELDKKVFVVIPTKMGVNGAYEYVSSSQKDFRVRQDIKKSLGTAADNKIRYNNNKISRVRNYLNNKTSSNFSIDDKIVYCTPGHIKKVLLDISKYLNTVRMSNVNVNFCDYLMVDEVHLGSMDIDLVIKYWEVITKSFPHIHFPKLIKMSATYVSDTFTLKMVEDDLRYEKSIFYLDSYGAIVPKDLRDNTRTEPKPYDVIMFIPELLLKISKDMFESGEDINCLVFLPGIRDIIKVERMFRDKVNGSRFGDRCEFFKAHSTISAEELHQISIPKASGKYRFVFATNIAETSVTIPGVNIVVDSLYERLAVSGTNEVIMLKTKLISKTSADQRAGRTGRTTNGMVIRCCYESHYDLLEDNRPNEIKRLPVSTEFLKALEANMNLDIVFTDVKIAERARIIKRLSWLCCLRDMGVSKQITDLGKFASVIPLSVRNAVFIGNWIKCSADIYPGIVIAVIMELTPSIFNTGGVDESLISPIPLVTNLNVLFGLWNKRSELIPPKNQIRRYASKIGVSNDGLYEAFRRINEVIRIVADQGYDIEIFDFDPSDESFYRAVLFCVKKSFVRMENKLGTSVYIADGDYSHEYELSPKFLNVGHSKPNVIYAISITNYSQKNVVELWFPEDISTHEEYHEVEVDMSDDEESSSDDEEEEEEESSEDEEEEEKGDSSEEGNKEEETLEESTHEYDNGSPPNQTEDEDFL